MGEDLFGKHYYLKIGGGVRGVPETAKPHEISVKPVKPHRNNARNRKPSILSKKNFNFVILTKKSASRRRKEEMKGPGDVFAFIRSRKSH